MNLSEATQLKDKILELNQAYPDEAEFVQAMQREFDLPVYDLETIQLALKSGREATRRSRIFPTRAWAKLDLTYVALPEDGPQPRS